MTTYESPFPDAGASEVAPTLSFANTHVLRIDTNYNQGPLSKRVITYPHPVNAAPMEGDVAVLSQPLDCEQIRDTLISERLVLGRQIEDPSKDYASFVIPGSARPAKFDAPHSGEGPYSYGDANMFTDMGFLLARLALTGPEYPVVIDRAIGLNTAIVEFTRINERKLLLVPGFELSLKSVEDDDAATAYYEKKLASEFDARFNNNATNFLENFRRVFGGLLDTK